MTDFVVIFWTCATKNEAKKIIRLLLEKKLIACANVFPSIESIFFWEGKVQEEKEVFVFLKTKNGLFDQVKDLILQHTSYEVAEILKMRIDEGFKPYLSWIDQSCS